MRDFTPTGNAVGLPTMNSTASHKPRAKGRRPKSTPLGLEESIDLSTNTPRPAFPLAALLWPARRVNSDWIVLTLILMVVGLFRWTIGLWSYSGESMLLGVLLDVTEDR